MPRSRQSGSVRETVRTISESGMSAAAMAVMIRTVRLEKMLALMPEPRPSERTKKQRSPPA